VKPVITTPRSYQVAQTNYQYLKIDYLLYQKIDKSLFLQRVLSGEINFLLLNYLSISIEAEISQQVQWPPLMSEKAMERYSKAMMLVVIFIVGQGKQPLALWFLKIRD
jgi:hypothetical protein